MLISLNSEEEAISFAHEYLKYRELKGGQVVHLSNTFSDPVKVIHLKFENDFHYLGDAPIFRMIYANADCFIFFRNTIFPNRCCKPGIGNFGPGGPVSCRV